MCCKISTFHLRPLVHLVQRRFKSSLPQRTSDPFFLCSEAIDVRSPVEFEEDHIPGAKNFPVLSDRERVQVGTSYSQNAFEARKTGARLVMQNIAKHMEDYFQRQAESYQPLVYCWRGGQRSRSLAVVLAEVGFQVHVLHGGYKLYRQRVMQDLDVLPCPLQFRVLTGLTGTGKTRLLGALQEAGAQVLDLEGLARHKGSLLGAWPGSPQPSQRAFESALHQQLKALDPAQPVWVESESRKVGNREIPTVLFDKICSASRVEVRLPLEGRVAFIKRDYPYWMDDPKQLKEILSCLVKIRGHHQVAEWISLVDAGRWDEFIASMLQDHYDPTYRTSLKKNSRSSPAKVLTLTDLSDQTLCDVACSLHTGVNETVESPTV